MKRTFLALVLLQASVPVWVFAQQYAPFNANRNAWYGQTVNLLTTVDRAVRIDSIVENAGDSTFYNYSTTTPNPNGGPDCQYRYGGPSWLGASFIRKADGRWLFHNLNGDSIVLMPQQAPGLPWKVCDLPGQGYLEGTFAQPVQTTVLDSADSVKFLQFQAYDGQGNPISHAANSTNWGLSSRFGMVQVPDFRYFPDDPSTRQLTGCTHPNLGRRHPTIPELYDFEVGDLFHWLYTYHLWWDETQELKVKERILSKYVSANGDTIRYETLVDYWDHSFQTYGAFLEWDRFGSRIDTITLIKGEPVVNTAHRLLHFYPHTPVQFSLDIHWPADLIYLNETGGIALGPDSIATELPFVPGDSLAPMLWDHSRFWARTQVNTWPKWMRSNGSDCLFDDPENATDAAKKYAVGLGPVFYEYIGHWYELHRYQIKFYKKGNESWGTPWVFSTDTEEADPGLEALSIQVYPNPSSTDFRFQLEGHWGKGAMGSVYDASGRLVNQLEVSPSGQAHFLPPSQGIYFAVFTHRNGHQVTKKLIFQ